jgi:hypothetical protein
MKTIIAVAVIELALVVFCLIGALGAFALDRWDQLADRREQRRLRREKLREVIR